MIVRQERLRSSQSERQQPSVSISKNPCERRADRLDVSLVESRRQVSKLGKITVFLHERAHFSEIAGKLVVLSSWQTEVHVILGACV
ncbi:hypothetical protein DF034_33315 [Burkholderia anthina]|nr:hypothetical protein DF034_33315 [Burkholderia anthina]